MIFGINIGEIAKNVVLPWLKDLSEQFSHFTGKVNDMDQRLIHIEDVLGRKLTRFEEQLVLVLKNQDILRKQGERMEHTVDTLLVDFDEASNEVGEEFKKLFAQIKANDNKLNADQEVKANAIIARLHAMGKNPDNPTAKPVEVVDPTAPVVDPNAAPVG